VVHPRARQFSTKSSYSTSLRTIFTRDKLHSFQVCG
jgi:hypothetical protein